MSKPRVYLTMIGAAGNEVTGSCTLLKIVLGKKVYYGLIDVGIVQGRGEYRNYQYPVDSEQLDFVIVTHAHADHFLASPLLRDFEGKIYGTASTFAQGKELLDDAAYNYERKAAEELGISHDVYRELCSELEDMRRRSGSGHLERYRDLSEQIKEIRDVALYTQDDVEYIEQSFCPVIPYQAFVIADGIYGRLIPATHQNGAVSVELYIGDYGEDSVNLSFSGDIGPTDSFLYRAHPYEPNNLINYCVMEALHGVEERTDTPEDTYKQLKKLIYRAVKKEKTVIIAGFALDRSAMILYAINRMLAEKHLDAPVYLDSPLAFKELVHYRADYNSRKSLWFKDLGKDPFSPDRIHVANKRNEHLSAMQSTNSKVIITASAFGEGGRVIDYFDHYIQDENAIFIFMGWLSPDCSSNILHTAEKGKIVEVHERNYVKHCDTYQLSGFSAHGYFSEFQEHLNRYPKCKGLILNHAERDAKHAVKEKLSEDYNFEIYTPEMYDGENQCFYMLTANSVTELDTMEGYGEFQAVMNRNVMYKPSRVLKVRIED